MTFDIRGPEYYVILGDEIHKPHNWHDEVVYQYFGYIIRRDDWEYEPPYISTWHIGLQNPTTEEDVRRVVGDETLDRLLGEMFGRLI